MKYAPPVSVLLLSRPGRGLLELINAPPLILLSDSCQGCAVWWEEHRAGGHEARAAAEGEGSVLLFSLPGRFL